jgi:DNA-binding transcriptional LysR family regulator
MRRFEWSDLHFFLELVRTGTPAQAARRLKADHTTVRRRIAALEAALRTRLFSSRGSRYELTIEGERLLKYAEQIEALTIRAEDEIFDSDVAINGTVRVGTPDGFGAYYLASRSVELTQANPQLQFQLVILPTIVNLSKREADIAIGLSPPSQHSQVVRRLTDFTLGLYASESYLQSSEPVHELADLKNHRLVSYVPELAYAPELDLFPELKVDQSAAWESSSISAQMEATAAGAGISILPDYIAMQDKRLHLLLRDFSIRRQYWLIVHPEMVNISRVRTAIDFIVECVRKDRSQFVDRARPPLPLPTEA